MNRDIEFGGVSLTLQSESGLAYSFIDCEGATRAFVFRSGEDTTSVVRGFVIQNAAADTGGAVWCSGGSSPKFEDCVFQLNSATDLGGAIACTGGSHPLFRRCEIQTNQVSGGASPRGAGVACTGSSNPVFSDCGFAANTAASFGGGLLCDGSSPTLRSCTFMFNEATTGGGGAIFSFAASAPEIESCTFIGNTAGMHGGAISGQSSPVSVSDCLFYQNESVGYGGALSFLYPLSTGQFTDCMFVGNYAQVGGVLYCFDSANLTFGNCTFVTNSALVDAALAAVNNAAPVFTRSIIASSEGAALTYCGGTADPVFFRCVVFGNDPDDDLCGSVSDTLHRDPLFCDAAGADWQLCADSVCGPANNPWSELIGAKPVGCGACGSAVEATTWGGIKALFH
jgi:predicted outer membrane repeat protein